MAERLDLTGLTAVERELLRLGVTAASTSASHLLEYGDAQAMQADRDRLAGLIASGGPMSRSDFRRALLATELSFASETLGIARDWSSDTGFDDRDTITVLRTLQGRAAGLVHGSADRLADAGPGRLPSWSPISTDTDGEYWTPFYERFQFRPHFRPAGPAILEPVPSVTVDLGPIFRASSHAAFAAGAQAVDTLTLLAMTRVLEPDTSLVVLDWQHQSHRFWPHRFACQPDPQWLTSVFPNGDYHIFFTEDMSTGTFGHPWEQTLCVFGEPLVSALIPMLTSWLPVTRENLPS
ncbi:DUF2716 domain-containing protein [Catellatospora methionotrophica]|uniref:DUF2716 domain-containing protein n=1 Tax=Catellatospora methionotrophica TaxID=121620 RepID=UPI0033EDFDFA